MTCGDARGHRRGVTPGVINYRPGKSAVNTPASANPDQMQGQQGQADEQQAGRVENGADGRAGGIDDECDRKKNGRNNGEHGRSFRSAGGPAAPAGKREVSRVQAAGAWLCEGKRGWPPRLGGPVLPGNSVTNRPHQVMAAKLLPTRPETVISKQLTSTNTGPLVFAVS